MTQKTPVILRRCLQILWPSFLMAGVTELLVFAVVDPGDLRWFGGEVIGCSSSATYTVSFLIFWFTISMATAITALLLVEQDRPV